LGAIIGVYAERGKQGMSKAKAAFILAASLAALGLATLAAAQESTDDLFVSVPGDEGPWYLQRSSCTLAHNATDQAENESERGILVVWFGTGTGTDIEFRDRRLGRGQIEAAATLVVTVDGAARGAYGAQGLVYANGGRGYRLSGPPALLGAIAAGRRLELRRDGRPVLQLDLAGAGPAIAALRACRDDAQEMSGETVVTTNGM
jgi:hypothetical protein